MAQHIKALSAQAWQLLFSAQNPWKGGKREPTPQSHPLTSTVHWDFPAESHGGTFFCGGAVRVLYFLPCSVSSSVSIGCMKTTEHCESLGKGRKERVGTVPIYLIDNFALFPLRSEHSLSSESAYLNMAAHRNTEVRIIL